MNTIYDMPLTDFSPSTLMTILSHETGDLTEDANVVVVGTLYRKFERDLPDTSSVEIVRMILALAEMTQDAVAICRTHLGFALLAADPERLIAA